MAQGLQSIRAFHLKGTCNLLLKQRGLCLQKLQMITISGLWRARLSMNWTNRFLMFGMIGLSRAISTGQENVKGGGNLFQKVVAGALDR